MTEEIQPINIDFDFSISERDFHQNSPQYATFAHASFDGANFHVVFLVTTPTPTDTKEKTKAEVVARLVLPPPAVVSTIQALQDAFAHPVVEGIYAPLYTPNKLGSDDVDNDPRSSTAEAERDG